MKWKWMFALGVVLLAAGGLVFAYHEMSKERKAEAEREKPVTAKSRVSVGTNGETILTLDRETQARIALKSEPAKPAKIKPEVKGYGRVIDPAPLTGLVAELDSAEAGLAGSQKEFERLKILIEQKNASDRALQAAEAAARRDQIQVAAVRSRVLSAWGRPVAERTDLASFARALASLESALVRIDLPAGESLKALPAKARIVALNAEDNPIEAELLGPAPSVDPQMQGQAFLFIVKTNTLRLAPGAGVSAYLEVPGTPQEGGWIPESAVVRHAGRGWVYVQTGDEAFTRREIALDHNGENGWIVNKGIATGERVVVSGAQALLSEEQRYQIKFPE
jgi:hypothetical protein